LAAHQIGDYQRAIQALVDQTAHTKQFNDGVTLASYKDSTNADWAAQASAFIAWRDQVWAMPMGSFLLSNPERVLSRRSTNSHWNFPQSTGREIITHRTYRVDRKRRMAMLPSYQLAYEMNRCGRTQVHLLQPNSTTP